MNTVKEFFNLKLLVTPMFLLMALNGFLGMLGFFVPLFFLPGMAEKNGVEPWMASYLISIYGKKQEGRNSFQSYDMELPRNPKEL